MNDKNFDRFRVNDEAGMLDRIWNSLKESRRREVALNTLRALGAFTKEQAGKDFGVFWLSGKLEKVGPNQYRVK